MKEILSHQSINSALQSTAGLKALPNCTITVEEDGQ